jgi:hypothetical protein
MKTVKIVFSLMALMLTLTGCPNVSTNTTGGTTTGNDPNGANGTDTPTNPIDPLNLEWQAVGPATGALGACLGPFYVMASANLTSEETLNIASPVGPDIHFYSTAGCGNETATILVQAGSNTSSLFYIADLNATKSTDNAIYTVSKGNTAIVYASVSLTNYNN